MKKAVLILANHGNIDLNILKDAYVIGVDKGALSAINLGIKLDLAVGDFDSITEKEYEIVKNNVSNIHKLNPVKDMTDTNEAISFCKDASQIYIMGGIKGPRIEHFISNLIDIANDNRIKMIDDNSFIEVLDKSCYAKKDYKFISIFSIDNNTKISLKGFKYELNDYNLKLNDPLCISNQIIGEGYIDIKCGRIIVIYSKED